MQQILPPSNGTSPNFPKTPVIAYGGRVKDAVTGKKLGFVRNSPGPTFEVKQNKPILVKWINDIPANMPLPFPVDPTLDWADPNMICMWNGTGCECKDPANFTCMPGPKPGDVHGDAQLHDLPPVPSGVRTRSVASPDDCPCPWP